MERVAVAGAGLAGARAVEELRAQGYEGAVTLVGAEKHLPYDRPPLSKAVLAGDSDDTTLDVDWDGLGVELLLGRRATGLRDGVLETDAGPLDFDGLVIATGAGPIHVPGGPYRTLRTIDDASALRDALRPGRHIAIVGAGWIGAEVATAAAAADAEVTVVEAAQAPLAMAVGERVGACTVPWYAEAGVALRLGVRVETVEPGGLSLVGGEFLAADEVLVGVGVRPGLDWLDGSGVTVDDASGGVEVDESLRASRPGMVAAGDCAAWRSLRFGRRLCVEHWDNALHAPRVAVGALLGTEVTYDPVPYFWSEQFGRMVQYAGHHEATDELLWRGDPSQPQWSACWLRDGVLVAVLATSRPRDLLQGRRLIAAGATVDRDRLTDPGVRLRDATVT